MMRFIRRFFLQFLLQQGSFKTLRTRLASCPCLANTELSDFESPPSFIDSSWLSNNPEGCTSRMPWPPLLPEADSPEESWEDAVVLLLLCSWDTELLEVLESNSESESGASNRCNMTDCVFMESFEHQSWLFDGKQIAHQCEQWVFDFENVFQILLFLRVSLSLDLSLPSYPLQQLELISLFCCAVWWLCFKPEVNFLRQLPKRFSVKCLDVHWVQCQDPCSTSWADTHCLRGTYTVGRRSSEGRAKSKLKALPLRICSSSIRATTHHIIYIIVRFENSIMQSFSVKCWTWSRCSGNPINKNFSRPTVKSNVDRFSLCFCLMFSNCATPCLSVASYFACPIRWHQE